MTRPALVYDEERIADGARFLSHSRVNRYLHCPEQYRLYYVEGLRPRIPAANLVFGQVVHQALAQHFEAGADPASCFDETWRAVREIELTYGARDIWEKLEASGRNLLAKFLAEERPKLRNVTACEKRFTLGITSLELPFVGVVDLVAELEGVRTVVDFKTAASGYEDHEVALSDQLSAYRLAEPEATQAALCVLVKTKEPRIEWHLTTRSADQLETFLAKVGYLAREIHARRFYKRPGKWCSWCDFLPVCLGDSKRIEETLVSVR